MKLLPPVVAALIGLMLAFGGARAGAAPKRMSTTCVEDDQVPTPKGYEGWER